MGQLKRQLVMWSAIAVTATVLPGLALADPVSPQHDGGRHGRGGHDHGDHHGAHHHGDAKLSVAGRAISRGTTDSYGLQIRGGSGEQPTAASGFVRFVHRGANGMDGLAGEITCLSKDAGGAVKVSGTITRSAKRTRGEGFKGLDGALDAPVRHERDRGELAGKDFAFTIQVTGKPQKFSQPTIGDKGTLTACSGGGTPTLEVTRGRFRAHDAETDSETDGRDHDHGHDHHHRWHD